MPHCVRDLGRNAGGLLDSNGAMVGELSRDFQPPPVCAASTAIAVVQWNQKHSEAQYSGATYAILGVVVAELVFELA